MKSLAQFCYRRRRFVVLGWIALLVGLFALSAPSPASTRPSSSFPAPRASRPSTCSKERGVERAHRLLRAGRLPRRPGRQRPGGARGDGGLLRRHRARASRASRSSARTTPENAHQISDDGTIAYAEINFADREQRGVHRGRQDHQGPARRTIDVDGLQVELGGYIFAAQPDFSSELIGIGAAVIILLIAFGSLLAMGLPIITALFGVGSGAALIGLLTRVLDVPEFTTPIAAMIGIGVGIDYALLIVTRYRQALHDGLEPRGGRRRCRSTRPAAPCSSPASPSSSRCSACS